MCDKELPCHACNDPTIVGGLLYVPQCGRKLAIGTGRLYTMGVHHMSPSEVK